MSVKRAGFTVGASNKRFIQIEDSPIMLLGNGNHLSGRVGNTRWGENENDNMFMEQKNLIVGRRGGAIRFYPLRKIFEAPPFYRNKNFSRWIIVVLYNPEPDMDLFYGKKNGLMCIGARLS
jgi:hypothetical protein